MDETSTNTRENAANVKQLIDERGFKSIILVTSPYHQRRAEIAFRRMLGPTFTIINHSAVWFNSSRGDGSGGPDTPDGIVADARSHGILWVNAAGNHAQRHWSGTFADSDGDGFHNFSGPDQGNTGRLKEGVREAWNAAFPDDPVPEETPSQQTIRRQTREQQEIMV